MEYILSIDAGTTSFKGALFDKDFNLVASSSSSYELIATGNGFVEFPAEGYLKALKSVINDLIAKSDIKPKEITSMAIDSQGETLILLDEKDKPLYNAIVWLDGRAVTEASLISKEFSRESVYSKTGQPEIAPTWPACKLLWVREHFPEVFKKIHKIMLLEDYLIYCLTGKFIAERSLLTSTIYYDINSGDWWGRMLEFIGISIDQLPSIYNSGEAISAILPSAAIEFGLSQKTILVTGALDQLSGMIGSGSLGLDICESTGTCMAVCANVKSPPGFNPGFQIPCHAGINESHFYQIYWSQTAGAVLEWFKNNFYRDLPAGSDIYEIMNDEASKINAGSDGVVVIPHLSGKACPEFNPMARGVFHGISLMHGRGHLVRAIMESVAFMLREHIQTAELNGRTFNEIRSLGGASNSPLWNQIKADVTGKRIVTLENGEATGRGTAILAGMGTGLFSDIIKVSKDYSKLGRIYEPDSRNKEVYNKGYEKYTVLYESLKATFGK